MSLHTGSEDFGSSGSVATKTGEKEGGGEATWSKRNYRGQETKCDPTLSSHTYFRDFSNLANVGM